VSNPTKQARFEEAKTKAEKGDSEAQYQVGLMYNSGDGVKRSSEEGARWLRKAADQENPGAQFWLGLACLSRQDGSVEAEEWFRKAFRGYHKAAEEGDAVSQFELGQLYESGYGTPKNGKESVRWYRKAAEQGIVQAQINLALIIENGKGVDRAEAFEWMRKAAKQGDSSAQMILGGYYANGIGTTKDNLQAAAWYRRASLQGDRSAQSKLGEMYEKGQGVTQDYVEAYQWLQLSASASQGSPRFAQYLGEKLKDLERRMTAEQLATARKRIAAFVPRKETVK
jgi:TPR repeat protein